jgi:surface antigen
MIKKTIALLIGLTFAANILTSCADQGGALNKQEAGTLIGAAGGALLGSQFGKGSGKLVGVAVGTLIGASLGNSIGQSLDRADLAHLNRTTQYALETSPAHSVSEWRNPDSGNYGTVTPIRTYQRGDRYCREFQQTIYVGGRAEQGYGTACRQPDGSWKIEN